MARKRRKRKHVAKRRKHARAKSGLRRKSGMSRSASAGSIGISTLPQVALSWAIVRLLSGATYAYFRGQLKKTGADPKKIAENFSKAKVIVPAVLLVAVIKKWLPFNMPGLAPILLQSSLNALVENTESLRKLADLEFLDQQPGTVAKPTAGYSPRSWRQTANQIAQAQRGLGSPKPQQYALPNPRGAVKRQYELGVVSSY